jgi:hypothetical protein
MGLVLVLFEHEIAVFAGIEVPHAGVLLLDPLEETQNRLTPLRKSHFRVEVEIDVIVVGKRTVHVHDPTSTILRAGPVIDGIRTTGRILEESKTPTTGAFYDEPVPFYRG